MELAAARFGVSFEQACHRLSTLQRTGARGVPFFFLRVDPAGNVSKRFSAAGFPFARFGGSCPRWVVHTAFAQPGTVQVQVAELPDGAAFLCFARTVRRRPRAGASRGRCTSSRWAAPWPTPARSPTPTAWIWSAPRCGIGLSCRLCDRPDCHSRAFPAAGAPAVAGPQLDRRDPLPVRAVMRPAVGG